MQCVWLPIDVDVASSEMSRLLNGAIETEDSRGPSGLLERSGLRLEVSSARLANWSAGTQGKDSLQAAT